MHYSINKTMIAAVAALTMGVALAGSAGSAFADPSNSRNPYNPLNPYAATNSAEIGSFSSNGSAVGSIDSRGPIVPAGQVQTNCHLFTHGIADCSSAWTPGQNVD